jgi:hypothetical protein
MTADTPHLFAMVRRGQLEAALHQLVGLFRDLEADLRFAGTSFPFPMYDEICTLIGHSSAFELLAPNYSPVKDDHDIVLITEANAQGGHLEIIRDIADANDRKLFIVATNLYNRSRDVVLPALAKHSRVLNVVTLDQPDLVSRLRYLQSMIANPAAQRVLILCHGHDAVTISAAAPVRCKPVLFFHHCDHTPSLGCYMPDAAHIDLHNLAYEQCRSDLGLDSCYICMTSREGRSSSEPRTYAKPMFKSISCGGEHKVTNLAYPIGYSDLVVELIRGRRGTHFHVGKISAGFIEMVHQALDQAGLPRDSFIYVGHVSGFREIIEALEIDLYVPTLPQAGGKALIDAMSAGVPILIHENAIGRLWGGRDLAYPEAPHWNCLEALTECLRQFDDHTYWRDQVQASRRYFDRYHSNALFKKMLLANGRLEGCAPPALKPYRPSHQERLSAMKLAAGGSSNK